VLKKRIHPKTKTGEPLINKLGRDCFLLRLASKGEYSDDLKDVFNLKSSARNNSCVDSEVVTSTPHTCSDYSVRETLIKIESSMLEMKVNYEKEQSVLNDKIDNLYKTNEKLDYNFNKQKERLNNVQTQLNSTRNANTKLNETITSLEKQIKELLTHQSELKRGQIEQKNMKRTTDSTFNEIKESVKHNANLIEKCKKKSDSTSLLAYDLKMRLDSEASRITNITDSRATGICSLKTRVQVIGECVKDMESTVEEIPSKVKSCLASITEIRKRVNAIEKNCNQINTPATKSYAMAISEVPRKENTVLSGEPPPQLVKSTQSSLSNPNFIFDNPTSIIAPTKNIETVTNHTDHYIKNISETNTFNETSDTRTTIPAYFPRSMCNPTSIDFKGVVKKTRRISRFYIGGIDKSCSSEESMRKFLLDRNIHVTFLRYFYRPSRGTAAAQLNVNMDDEHLLKQPNFWPEGIFMKPWLPWEQFINEHSIEQKHGRY
jgi:predicted nuclease with TOPRIM domain